MSNHSNYPKEAGIYKLTCVNNGKIYIGKAVNIFNRLTAHRNSEKYKTTYYFQRAIKKYGWESFTVEILEIFENFDKSKDNLTLLKRESYYIDMFNSNDDIIGYNICSYSNDRTGIPVSEETRKRMSQPRTEEHKKNLSLSRLGKKRKSFTAETREKMRQSKLGKTLTEEHKESMRQANLGKTLTEEHKRKIGLANKKKIIID